MQFIEQIWILYNIPLLLTVYTLMLGVAALICAPFGALICALIAWRRRLSPWRCAIAGASCSPLFFLPWVYLAARMLGRTIPKPLVALAYFVLYATWGLGPFRFTYVIWSEGRDPYPALWLCAWVLNALAMAVSILMMTTPIFDKVNPFRRASREDGAMRDALPNPIYLLPFASLWGSIIIVFALMTLVRRAAG